MTYVAPTTHVAGETLPAADYNVIVNDVIAHQSVMSNVQIGTTSDTSYSNAPQTYTDCTGLTVSITPTFNTSKILIMVNTNFGASSTDVVMGLRLLRDSTPVGAPSTAGSRTLANAGDTVNGASNLLTNLSFNFVDSPATTSAITYKVQAQAASGTIFMNRANTDTDNAAFYRLASHIIVMEIPA